MRSGLHSFIVKISDRIMNAISPRSKLAIYTFNVVLIQALGKINVKLIPYHERWTRPDRLCYCAYEDSAEAGLGMVSHISCCDCGASHYLWKANKGIYGIPARPEGYTT